MFSNKQDPIYVRARNRQESRPDPLRQCAEDVNPKAIGVQVVQALRQMATELETGALLTIDPKRTRMRVLPLQMKT